MTTKAALMRIIEWVAIAVVWNLLSFCLIVLGAGWLILIMFAEILMDIKKIGSMKVLEWVAIAASIAVSTLSMVFYGGYWTFIGLLIGAFWIILAIEEFKMHRRMEEESRKERFYIGDLTCRYNARSQYLRCSVNPNGSCEGCSDYNPR